MSRHNRRFRASGPDGYAEAPGSGMVKLVPATRMPPGDGDEKRRQLALEGLGARPYIDSYRKLAGPGKEMSELLQQAIDAENELRKKFAQDRDHPDLNDRYVGLLPVHCCQDIFSCRELSPEEAATPKAFPLAARRVGPAVVSKEEFTENFEIFTEGLLRGLNWDNVFAAGGSVLAALLPMPPSFTDDKKTRQGKRRYFHHEAYTASDVDLFFYGLDESQADEKLKEIYYCICDSFPDPSVQPLCFRTQHAVTIVSKFPYRHVQVVLRLYKSPAEVLAGFDVDACSVGFDGSNVWMTPRCHNSVTAGYNTVDMSRRSPTYEVRLAKYASRGMEVAVPVLDRQSVDPQIYETPFEKTKGLMKLLLLEKLSTPAQRLQYKQQQRVGRLQPLMVRRGGFYNVLQEDMKDVFLQAQIDGTMGDVSDYETVFLPWGPKWDANKVRNLVYTKDMLLNSTFVDPFHKGFRHPCFFGTAAEVLEDCSGDKLGKNKAPVAEDEEAEEDDDNVTAQTNTVKGRLKWMTVDPGQQSIGSFHPITAGEWAEGVHLSASTEHLVKISQDLTLTVEAAKKAMAAITPAVDSATVNMRDSAGRTPLMLASLAGNPAATQAFVDHGALLNSRLQDGRTALHLAAQYGRHKVVPALLQRGEVLNSLLGEHLKKMEDEERALAQNQVQEEQDLETLREEEGSQAFFRALHVLKRKRAVEAARRSVEREEQGYLDKLDVDGLDYDQKMSPLMYAVFFGHTAVVGALLDGKADPSKKLILDEGRPVATTHQMLTLACHNSHSEVLGMLLEHRATAEEDASGRTPLHHAALWGETECVKLLVQPREEGGEPPVSADAVDQSGSTALAMAVTEGHVSVVEVLLAHTGKLGALASAPKKKHVNQMPLVTLAVESQWPEVLALLLQSRGDPNAAAPNRNSSFQHNFCFSGRFGGQAYMQEQGTVLDFAENKLTQEKERLKRIEKSLPEPAEPEPQILPTEFFDFLLSRTPSGFERFALTELRRRAEEQQRAAAERQTNAAKKSPKSLMEQAEVSGEDGQKKTFNTLTEIVRILVQHGAKHERELKEEQNKQAAAAAAGRSKSAPVPRKQQSKMSHLMAMSMQKKRGASPPPGAGAGAAFKLGVDDRVRSAPTQPFGFGLSQAAPCVSLNYSERFEPLAEPTGEWTSLDSEVASPAMQPRYKTLFDAVVAADVATVQSLCEVPVASTDSGASGSADAVAGPLLVAVRSSLLQLTLLEVAMLQDEPEVVRVLLRLAAKQHTPEPVEEEPEDEEVKFSDQMLMQLGVQDMAYSQFTQAANGPQMQELLREMQTFKRKGHKMLDRLAKYKAEAREGEKREPDLSDQREPERLISVCSVTKMVKPPFCCLHLGVRHQRYKAVEAFLSELNALDILETSEVKQPLARPPPSLKAVILRTRSTVQEIPGLSGQQLTPFELAVGNDDVRMAELLLANGAQDCLRGETEQEDVPEAQAYTGLLVAGKKREDWALSRRVVLSRTSVQQSRLRGLHIAAAAGAEKSIDFLLDGGMDSFAMVGDVSDGQSEEDAVLGSLFSLQDRDASGKSPLIYAIEHDQESALRKLLASGKAQMKEAALLKLLNDPRLPKKQLSPLPLHHAVASSKVEAVKLLLEYKAAPAACDGSNKTALLILVTLAENIKPQLKVKSTLLDVLLDSAQKTGCLEELLACPGPAAGETALHDAVSHQSQLTVKAILKRVSNMDKVTAQRLVDMKTTAGQTSLHLAVQHKGPKTMDIVKALLETAADPAILDNSGSSALHLAAKAGADAKVLALLVPTGDSPCIGAEDAAGRTPLEWLMTSQLLTLANKPQAGKPQTAEALALLTKAEAGGRKVVDPKLVREHTALATGAVASVAPAGNLFGGQAQSSSGGFFGSAQPQPGFFGSAQPQPGFFASAQPQPGSLFGGGQPAAGSLFGGGQPAAGGFFGFQHQPGIFGGAPTGLLGAQAAEMKFAFGKMPDQGLDDDDEDESEEEGEDEDDDCS